jgi:7-carboxy-7-deazaguanine synthase
MAKKGKIVEIYKTVQGEGKYVGQPQVFLRLSFCNMQCTYCDTDFLGGGWMNSEEVLAKIDALLKDHPDVTSVSVTGGEPLLQEEFLGELLPSLKERNLQLLLETNGTLSGPLSRLIPSLDIIAMDLKLPSSSLTEEFWVSHRNFLKVSLRRDAYVKVVLCAETTDQDFQRAVELVAGIDPGTCFIMQPVTPMGQTSLPRSEQMVRWMQVAKDNLQDVRLVPQMHRQWGMR